MYIFINNNLFSGYYVYIYIYIVIYIYIYINIITHLDII